MRRSLICLMALAALSQSASAGMVFNFSDPMYPGLGAQAEFDLLSPTMIQIRLKNTSTGAPMGFDSADQILTGVSWDFPPPGLALTTAIIGGTAEIGPTSASLNFSEGAYGPGTNIGGEWGFANFDGTGMLPNFISSNASMVTAFGGPNLDDPVNIDGPQGGLCASPPVVPIGGLGCIVDEAIFKLNLSVAIADLDFLNNGVRVEFGSDAAFITIPEPATLGLLGMALLAASRRRR